jgi:hypothetical protein
MAKHTYRVEHKGSIYVRTTNRIYTYVVIAENNRERERSSMIASYEDENVVNQIMQKRDSQGMYGKQYAFAWCGRRDLAVKQAEKALKYGMLNIEILEVPTREVK